jgi:hypothetical protein
MVNTTTMPLYSQERQPVPILQETGWALSSKPSGKIKKTSPYQGSNPSPPAPREYLFRLWQPRSQFIEINGDYHAELVEM